MHAVQYEGNALIEDRLSVHEFKTNDGYFVGVFDGHGGWQVAELCAKRMHMYLEQNMKGKKSEQDIKRAIVEAFDQVENDALQVTKIGFHAGFAQTAYVGSCALVAVVHDDKLYVANSGDCKGVLLSQKQNGEMQNINVSKTFSANKKYEQERLKQQFPTEPDIYICKGRNQQACYVKGGLMPSRSIGDFRLKYSEFNFHTFAKELGYRRPIPHYTGPYITHEPDIQVFELTKNDKWLVLATDGMWDQISRKQSAQILSGVDFSRASDKTPNG